MTRTKAWVVNGNKAYRHRVFVILNARVIKSWNTDVYLGLSKRDIKVQLEERKQNFQGRHG